MNGNKMNGMNGCGCSNQMNRPNNGCGNQKKQKKLYQLINGYGINKNTIKLTAH